MPADLVVEQVIIYNSLGQKILSDNRLDINISGLSSGVHYVEIQTAGGTIHKKFIKE
jgi:hypothetical protein